MSQKQFAWYLAPGFSTTQAMSAFRENGVQAVKVYDEISVQPKKGWKRVVITMSVECA